MPMNDMPKDYTASLTRHFSITSFVSIVIIAFAIIALHRFIAVNTIKSLGESINLSIARTALNSIQEDLSDHLSSTSGNFGSKRGFISPNTELGQVLLSMTQRADITRVKVYDEKGYVVFSTLASQIGRNQADNRGFRRALEGNVASKFVYQDSINPFDAETEDDNLIQSYLPVSDLSLGTVVGVFEIYTDVNELVQRAERAQLFVIPAAIFVFVFLYFALLLIVHRANRTYERQEAIIKERNRTLETLSAQLLSAQEEERKHLAIALHEDIAQTLSAVKLRFENYAAKLGNEECNQLRSSLVPFLQDAIDKVRSEAMRLRPSSLDDFGLLKAIAWLFREMLDARPSLKLSWNLNMEEDQVPRPLKTIIFRIVQDTLNRLLSETEADTIAVDLTLINSAVVLSITENGQVYRPPDPDDPTELVPGDALVSMKERTILSGGDYSLERIGVGSNKSISTWRD